MKSFATALALFAALAAHGQAPPKGCDTPESRQMDFWIGEWDAEYVQGGVKAKSRNRVTKVLDGCAIFEEFTGAPGIALDGRSYSVFDRAAGQWKQTWVDNSGAYLDFVGGEVDGNRAFTREFQRQGKTVRQRMVFTHVTRDAFKWLWQRSDDLGATWKTTWEIDYRRVK
jgi:hypothetical protein